MPARAAAGYNKAVTPANDITCVIFDFERTLCSESYFAELPSPARETVRNLLFAEGGTSLGEAWLTGKLSTNNIVHRLAEQIDMSAEDIRASLYLGCANMRFNRPVWKFAKEQARHGRKTALVTVSPDVFADVVVPSHDLTAVFDVIVSSAAQGRLRLESLWDSAFSALGPQYGYAHSLLIDDSAEAVSRFLALGGRGHRYVGDSEFVKWTRAMAEGSV